MIPGLGVICAGPDLQQAVITRDITKHTIAVKAALAAEGAAYLGLPEDELFRMEYRTLQHAKLGKHPAVTTLGAILGGGRAARATTSGVVADGAASLRGEVALVTGAAGAIG